MSLFVNHKTPKTEEPPKAKDKRICPQLIPPTWPIHTIHKNNETVIFVACWTSSPAMEASTQCGGVSIFYGETTMARPLLVIAFSVRVLP